MKEKFVLHSLKRKSFFMIVNPSTFIYLTRATKPFIAMEEEKDPSPDYLRDFNDGYRIAENEKDISQEGNKFFPTDQRLFRLHRGEL